MTWFGDLDLAYKYSYVLATRSTDCPLISVASYLEASLSLR